MSKFISRIGAKKQNHQIKLAIKKIGANVDHDGQLAVVWKRGPQTDRSQQYDVNEIEVDADATDVFTRISSFYHKDTAVAPKGCDFQIMLTKQGKEKMIGFVTDHDMAPFVGKSNRPQHIPFANAEVPNTFIDVEWTISTTNEKKMDEKLSQSLKGNALASSAILDLNLTGEEVKEAIQTKEQLKKDVSSIRTNMELVLAAKQSVEDKYNAEKKKRLDVEAQVREAKKALPNANEVSKETEEKLNQLRATNAQMKVEIQSIQEEIAQKQQIAGNLETESASLQKMIQEANQLGRKSDHSKILEAKDQEIAELKEQIAKIKAAQVEMLEKNKHQIEAIKEQKAAAAKGYEHDIDAYVY